MSSSALRAILVPLFPKGSSRELVADATEGCQQLWEIIAGWLTACLRLGHTPEPLATDRCAPLYKQRGKKTDPNNWRGISMASMWCKLFQQIMAARQYDKLLEATPPEQVAFQHGRPTIEGPLIVSICIAEASRQGLPLYAVQLDAEKAFDKVDRNLLRCRLAEAGILGDQLHSLDREMLPNSRVVEYDGAVSERFWDHTGIRQGDVRSPMMFNVATAGIIRAFKTWAGTNGFGVNVNTPDGGGNICMTVFADDITLLTSDPDTIQPALDFIVKYGARECTRFNPSKTLIAAIAPGRTTPPTCDWSINGQPVAVSIVKAKGEAVKVLGIRLSNGGFRKQSLGSRWAHSETIVRHMDMQAHAANRKLQSLHTMVGALIFDGPSQTVLFNSVKASLDWGRQLATVVLGKTAWRVQRDAVFMSLGINRTDRVSTLAAFHEAGRHPPAVQALIEATTFLEALRTLPDNNPAKLALKADVWATEDIPPNERVKVPRAPAHGQVLMLELSATWFAGVQWGLKQLGLEELLGGLGPEDSHKPYEPRPAPGPNEPPLLTARTLIEKAWAERWHAQMAASQSAARAYGTLFREYVRQPWTTTISPEETRRAFAHVRLGAARFHDWRVMHGRGSLLCTLCGLACSLRHALVGCVRSNPLRSRLRAKMLEAIDEVLRSKGTTFATEPEVSALAQSISHGIRVDGSVPTEAQHAWGLFLRGGDAPAPAPFAGHPAIGKGTSAASREARRRVLRLVPRYSSDILRCFEDVLDSPSA